MRIRDYLYILGGALAVLFGLVMVAGMALNWPDSENPVGDLALGAGLGVEPLLVGLGGIATVLRGVRRRRLEQLERQVLELAAASSGRLTPRHVAQATTLTLDEAKAFLDRLHLAGFCRTELTPDGAFFYTFDL